MNVRLVRKVHFEAAHRLPKVPEGHKCQRLHGHSFRAEIVVEGPVDPETGWFIDYAAIDDAWTPLYNTLDHNYLNDVEGLENPTSEVLCGWLWERLKPSLPQLSKIIVHETCNASCEYEG
ncbi:MAG: 6-carboxytetrahydropterin synthase QueD [Polyangiaceae bacterium]|nr:6-carboxytetrahydropterin synthase QueD [Polyangiaceae bacterium]